MSDELKPCPLCGGDAEWVTTQGIRSPWSMVMLDALGTSVQCSKCGCTVPSAMDFDDAKERWNRRAASVGADERRVYIVEVTDDLLESWYPIVICLDRENADRCAEANRCEVGDMRQYARVRELKVMDE